MGDDPLYRDDRARARLIADPRLATAFKRVHWLKIASGIVRVATNELWVALGFGDVARRDRYSGNRISDIMHQFGFETTTMRIEGKVQRGYIRSTPFTEGD